MVYIATESAAKDTKLIFSLTHAQSNKTNKQTHTRHCSAKRTPEHLFNSLPATVSGKVCECACMRCLNSFYGPKFIRSMNRLQIHIEMNISFNILTCESNFRNKF